MVRHAIIAGGAGFLGSHLVARLLSEGYHVVCVDDLSTGSEENISEHLENPNFEFVEHDIATPISVECDKIYNLACPASPKQYMTNPIKTFKTSIFGTINLLDLANQQKCKMLQVSTSEVYGDPTVHPQPETYLGNVNTTGPRACYDEGKRAAEAVCFDYQRQLGVDVRVVRVFNTYGPKMDPDDGRVVSNFITQALKGEDITVYGDGSQTRSFCYVDDLIEGFCRTMARETQFAGPINLGNPEEYSVKDLAHKVLSIVHSSSQLVYKELPQDDPKRRRPDITKAQDILDWSPKVSVDDGLARTVDWFRGTRKN